MKVHVTNFGSVFKKNAETDRCNREVAVLSLDEIIDSIVDDDEKDFCTNNDFAFYGSGWQSWGFGGELDAGKKQAKYFPIVPQWKKYFEFSGEMPKKIFDNTKNPKDKSLLVGGFIIYFRWNHNNKNTYVVLASNGNVKNDEVLPPVKFYVDRKTRKISVTLCSDGKTWKNGDKMYSISMFCAHDFFDLKDTIKDIYIEENDNRLESISFLNSDCKNKIRLFGWESWYNHYANINDKIISDDLSSLSNTNNLLKICCVDKKNPCVFQVDDGWEKGLGQWDVDESRFPKGMKNLSENIKSKGYIPGLWIAPFIIDLRTQFAKDHYDWILKDKNGKPIYAGMNLLWGAAFGKNQPNFPYSYYCFDLSNEEVLSYLDSLMDKVINDWGFRYLKLDFLFAGMIKGEYKNKKAIYEIYDNALKILTKRKTNKNNEKVAYLGCGMPFDISFKYLPLSRIGPDTKEDWDVGYLRRSHFPARTSAYANMQSTLGHAFWNESVFVNDPDVVFLRYTNISLNDDEKTLIALVNFLFASQIMHSDDPIHFEKNTEGKFTKKILELYELLKDEEFAQVNNNSDSYFIYSKNNKYCGFINLSEKNITVNKINLRLYNDTMKKTAQLSSIINSKTYEEVAEKITFKKHTITIFSIK